MHRGTGLYLLQSKYLAFTFVSGVGWLIDIGLTTGSVAFGAQPFFASTFGAATAVTFVYVVSRLSIFGEHTLGAADDFALYVLWQIAAIAVASACVALLAHLFQPFAARLTQFEPATVYRATQDGLPLATLFAKIVVTPLTLTANFLFVRWLLERRRQDPLSISWRSRE